MERRESISGYGDKEERYMGLINTNLNKLEKIQEEGNEIIAAINALHDKYQSSTMPKEATESLRELYKKGIDQAIREERICKTIVEDIDSLMALGSLSARDYQTPQYDSSNKRKRREESVISGGSSKLKKHKNGGSIIKNGSNVAAKQPKIKDIEENWILATVVSYKSETKQYEVEDADRDEASNRPGERFFVPAKNVMVIPNPNDIRPSQEFAPNTTVLALYPSTTCFYKASVVLPPTKLSSQSHQRAYLLTFEDDDNAQRYKWIDIYLISSILKLSL
ncbi:SAGA-associated factor 29 homolog B isoform X1 [Rhizophagus clarus]|uniref:SAGA-associated factor 29 homolog B isoform X1 n=1 Tax=Rhizophagus clarus TaxID=94130 RepID=A0A8H3QGZ3_9GLOM|nr:SAGA-associated factor 29 homolog B isoform X1 [Rhizophagus clarus]